MRTAKYWIGASLIVTLIGLVSLVTQGLNLGLDFTGGSLLDLKFDQPQTVEKVRAALGPDLKDSAVRLASPDGTQVLITTRPLDEDKRLQLFESMKKDLGNFTALRVEKVEGVISRDLTSQGLKALLIATVLQIIYISIRFEFKFAVTAIAALLHDTIIVLGLFSLFQVEVSAPFIAAMLTVMGYSVMDTIVIFDRIRENLRYRKKETLTEIVNKSINQSLTRSLYTSATTLLAAGAILFFGGTTTREFALALFLGVLSGTYSSILVASPIWLWWKEAEERSKRALKAKPA